MLKKSSLWLLVLCLIISIFTISVFASETNAGSDTNESAEENLPKASVSVLDPITLTPEDHDYMVWPSGDDTVARPLQIVMNFKAEETLEEAMAGAYGKYICDFYLSVNGLANSTITADNCYLAGNYGTFGWIVIPTDGLVLEEGVEYPVVSGYDANLTYENICDYVKDFTAAIYIAPEILEANPDFEVTLELRMKNPETEEFLTVGEPAVYDVADLEKASLPKASVSVLDPITLTPEDHKYMVWPNGDASVDRPLQIVMNFKAEETLAQAKAGKYGKYICDFYLSFKGLANGTITADNCYLAGNYGTFGWIVIPTDGLVLEEGVEYPVVSGYDANLTYENICDYVKDFTAAIYIAPEILEANPDFEVTLELRMKNPETEEFLTVGEPAVYNVESLNEGKEQLDDVADIKGNTQIGGEIKAEDNETAIKEAIKAENGNLTEEEINEAFENATVKLEIKFESLEFVSGETPKSYSYTVSPMLTTGNTNVKISTLDSEITFKLPVHSEENKLFAKVYHEGVEMEGLFEIKTAENGEKYVEVKSATFSTYTVEPTDIVTINGEGYASLADALSAASSMTGDVVVEIGGKVTLAENLSGSYSSIKFVGTTDTAEIYLDVQGYITATGKSVVFEDLKLSKSEGGFINNAGFMNVAFGVYDVKNVTYNNCIFLNGAYASSGVVEFNGCTFYRSHDKYGLWAYGDVDAIVDGCIFADYRGIKMYAEDKAKTTELTVTDTDFSAVNNKPAIVLTYGESVTLEGNTYSETGTFELDLDGAPNGVAVESDVAPICKNDNGSCGVLVDGKIYTTVAQAAEVATAGSEVTLLHDSDETVEFAEGVVLDTNGYTADNVTVAKVYVAQIGDQKFETLAEAAAAATEGDEIVLLADAYIAESTDVTVPAGVILNGNGFSIFASGADFNTTTSYGYVVAGGNLTIKGITKIEKFSASYYNHIITIGEGASLQVFGKNRVSVGYGSSFDITGTIADAKTADKSNIVPSLKIDAGISIVGSNDTYFNVTNAYVVIGSSSSKNSNAGAKFDFTFTNSIVEFTSQLTFSAPKYDTLNPVFNVTFENSEVTTGTKLCLMAPGSNVVVDKSNVTLGTYLHNSGNLTVQNESTFVGSMIQYGENGGNSGTITVDGAEFTIKNNNAAYAMDGNGTGKLILKNGATANVDYITETGIELGANSSLSSKSENLDVTTEPGFEAVYENGVYVPVVAPLPDYVVLPDGMNASNYEALFGSNTVTDGVNYYATLQAAVQAIADAKTANAVLYCKPGADVGSLQHAPVINTLTVYGNGAYVSGGSERDFDIGNTDPSGGNDITSDITLTVKYLDGCGAWGAKATEHTVNLVFENCGNMGKVFITGTTGTLNITMTDCAFDGVIAEALYSNANGNIELTRVAFSNLNKAINLNHKVAGEQNVVITDCTFTNCGSDVSADQIPVRVLSSVEGGVSTLTVSGCTFSGTPEGGADILLDYCVGTVNASVSGTAASVTLETENNSGTNTEVAANENLSFTNVVKVYVAQIDDVKYETLEDAFEAAKEGDTIVLLGDATLDADYGTGCPTEASVVDLGGFTLTLTKTDIRFGTIKFTNGNIDFADGLVSSTGIFYMFGDHILTFDAVVIDATGVSGTYLISVNDTADVVLTNGSKIVVNNESKVKLTAIISCNGSENHVNIENSEIELNNIDGRGFLYGNYTVSNSNVDMNGVKEGFYIGASQTLAIEGTSVVDIVLNDTEGRFGINLANPDANYTKAETATVNATDNKPINYVAQIGDVKYESVIEALLAAIESGATEVKILTDVREVMPDDIYLILKNDLTITADAPVSVKFYNDGTSYDFIIDCEVYTDYAFTIAENVTFELEDRVIWIGYNASNIDVVVNGTLAAYQIWVGGDVCVNEGATLKTTGEALVMRRGKTLYVDGGKVEANYFNILSGNIFAENGAEIECGAFWIANTGSYAGEGNVSISIWDSTLTASGNLKSATTHSNGVYIDLYNSTVEFSDFDGYGASNLDANTTLCVNGENADVTIKSLVNNGTVDICDSGSLDVTGNVTNNGEIVLESGSALKGPENMNVTASGDDQFADYVNGEYVVKVAIAQIGDVKYESLQAAIEAVQENETIVVLKDITFTAGANGNGISYTRGVSFTLDLNGKTVTSDLGNNALRFKIGDGNDVKNTTVTITIKNGKVVSGANNWCAISAATADGSGNKLNMYLEDLTVEANKAGDYAVKSWSGATVYANSVTVNAIYAGGFYAVGGEIVLDNCTVNQTGLHTAPYLSMAVAVSNGGKLTVNSGSYSTTPLTAGEANNQGTTHGSWCVGVMSSGGTLIINGGTFTNGNYGDDSLATAARSLICIDAGGRLEIYGGTFNALNNIIFLINNIGNASLNPTAYVEGGNFSADPTVVDGYGVAEIPETHKVVTDDSGRYNVVEIIYAAEVNGVKYESFKDALNAATADSIIVLLGDVDMSGEAVLLMLSKTIDLNGFNLKAAAFIAFEGSNIVDNGETKGVLEVPHNALALSSATYPMLPVWNANESTSGYVFVTVSYEDRVVVMENTGVKNSFIIDYRPNIAGGGVKGKATLADGAANNDLTYSFAIRCYEGEEYHDIVYNVSDDLIARVYTNNSSIRFTVTGASDMYDKYEILSIVSSKSGLSASDVIYTYVPTSSDVQ